jgi:hypothetical protein
MNLAQFPYDHLQERRYATMVRVADRSIAA